MSWRMTEKIYAAYKLEVMKHSFCSIHRVKFSLVSAAHDNIVCRFGYNCHLIWCHTCLYCFILIQNSGRWWDKLHDSVITSTVGLQRDLGLYIRLHTDVSRQVLLMYLRTGLRGVISKLSGLWCWSTYQRHGDYVPVPFEQRLYDSISHVYSLSYLQCSQKLGLHYFYFLCSFTDAVSSWITL